MIEETLLAVSDLSSPRFHTKFGKGQLCALRKIHEDPTGLYNGLHRQLSPPETSNSVQLKEACAIFPHSTFSPVMLTSKRMLPFLLHSAVLLIAHREEQLLIILKTTNMLPGIPLAFLEVK